MHIFNVKYLRKTVFLISITFFIFSTFSLKSQEKNNSKSLNKIINYSESIYGTDDLLVNGQPYLIKNKDVKGHPYFIDEFWRQETLFIKEKKFNNVGLNYDVEDDKLILETKFNKNLYLKIELSNEVIDSFNIRGHHFINSSILENYNGKNEYFEEIYNGDFIFLIKHYKTLDKSYYDNPPSGKYNKIKSIYYIYKDGILKKIKNKRAFLDYFKNNKKEIKKFMKKNKIKYNRAKSDELFILMEFCNKLSNV